MKLLNSSPCHASSAHILVEESASEVVAGVVQAVPELRARVARRGRTPKVEDDFFHSGVRRGDKMDHFEDVCKEVEVAISQVPFTSIHTIRVRIPLHRT